MKKKREGRLQREEKRNAHCSSSSLEFPPGSAARVRAHAAALAPPHLHLPPEPPARLAARTTASPASLRHRRRSNNSSQSPVTLRQRRPTATELLPCCTFTCWSQHLLRLTRRPTICCPRPRPLRLCPRRPADAAPPPPPHAVSPAVRIDQRRPGTSNRPRPRRRCPCRSVSLRLPPPLRQCPNDASSARVPLQQPRPEPSLRPATPLLVLLRSATRRHRPSDPTTRRCPLPCSFLPVTDASRPEAPERRSAAAPLPRAAAPRRTSPELRP